MADMTFYWHDYETFGTNPRRDRPAQFAGIRTDADLNIIGEPLNIYCRPAEDVLPHPQAVMVTGITPQQARDKGVSEPEFIGRILEEMRQPNTCSVGYNSLRFDDEVTRHTLWRNFFDPYAREWKDGCSRWDLIDTVRLAYALRPDGIVWPEREDEPGVPSFRLEHLAAANELEQENAHDALSDVHATIALARLIRDKKPKLWQWVLEHRHKQAAKKLLDLDRHTPALHVSQMFPARIGSISAVMPLALHPTNRNSVICFDLRHDPQPLIDLPAADVAERLFTPAKDLPADAPRVALKNIAVNKCPVLAPIKMLGEQEAERVKIDLQQMRQHWKALHNQLPEVVSKLETIYSQRQFEDGSDPEADLYGGFVEDDDRNKCNWVTRASRDDLAKEDIYFDDRRLNEIFFRYRARHFPDTLNADEQAEWHEHIKRQLQFAPDGGLNLENYYAAIETELQFVEGQPNKLKQLLELKTWGQQLEHYLDD